MKLRIHADEFGLSGGSEVAAQLRVRSADHLIFTDRASANSSRTRFFEQEARTACDGGQGAPLGIREAVPNGVELVP